MSTSSRLCLHYNTWNILFPVTLLKTPASFQKIIIKICGGFTFDQTDDLQRNKFITLKNLKKLDFVISLWCHVFLSLSQSPAPPMITPLYLKF